MTRTSSFTVRQAEDSTPWAQIFRIPQERGACGGWQPQSKGSVGSPLRTLLPCPGPMPTTTTRLLALLWWTDLSLPPSHSLVPQPQSGWPYPLSLRRKLLTANYVYSCILPRDLFCLPFTGLNSSEPTLKIGRFHPQLWVSAPQDGEKKRNKETFRTSCCLGVTFFFWLFSMGLLCSKHCEGRSVGTACMATSLVFIQKITGLATCPWGWVGLWCPCSEPRHQKKVSKGKGWEGKGKGRRGKENHSI